MNEPATPGEGVFSIDPWHAEGIAAIEATGPDRRAALEAGLRAVLSLAVGSSAPESAAASESGRAVPIQGDGDDLAALFADLIEDLSEQIGDFGSSLRDVALDGVLRREGGGLIAWGYAMASGAPERGLSTPRLHETPVVAADDPARVVIRAHLIRGKPG